MGLELFVAIAPVGHEKAEAAVKRLSVVAMAEVADLVSNDKFDEVGRFRGEQPMQKDRARSDAAPPPATQIKDPKTGGRKVRG